jgi:multiple sugar transport system substrate-binding protein
LLATPLQAVNSAELDHENAYFLKDGKTIFSTPAAVEMTTDWVELFEQGSPPSSIAWGYPEMVQGFSSGIVGFLSQTQEVIATIAESEALDADQWGTAPQPVGPNGDSPIVAAQGGWAVASSSKHTAESVKLAEFLTSAPQVIEFQKQAGYVPSVKSAADDEFFSTGYWAPYLYMNDNPDVYQSVTEPRNASWWSAWLVKSNNDVQSLLLGSITPAEMMADWDAYWMEKTEAAG